MPSVVTDPSPVFYLLSIGRVDLLPALFGTVLLPDAVHQELSHPAAPEFVRAWVRSLPPWLKLQSVAPLEDRTLQSLGAGERAAIALAHTVQAGLILIDERKATRVAIQQGFDVTGTLGILRLAARRNLVDLAACIKALKGTSFRYHQEILDELLRES